MNTKSFGSIKQVAYLVEDLDVSLRHWSDFTGIGPWTVYTNVGLKGWCRGQDTRVVINVGLSYQDGVQMEIIQVLSKTPSPYQDANGRTLVGMHHIAWMSDNLEADMEKATARGLKLAFRAENPASKVAYFESPAEPGILFEFIQTSPMLLEGFAQGVEASRNWDGREHILQTIDLGG